MTQQVNPHTGCYRVYGLTMTSDSPFPELPCADAHTSGRAVTVQLAAPFPRVLAPTQWIRQWPLSAGEPWLSCGKVDNGYLIRFREVADFFVGDEGHEIIGTAEPGTATATLRHLLLDQVLPLVLNLRGQDALHATAVVIPHGVCAFTGETGMGKSTLAASFAQAGYTVLCDDCLVIEEQDGHLLAVPAYPGVRLWDDARAALVSEDEVLSPMAHYTDKHRIVWPAHASAFPTRALPLHRLYLLTRETDETSTTSEPVPHIDRCAPRQGFMALLEQTFRLDVTDSAMLVRQMHWLERLVSRVPVRRLVFPTALSALPTVREAILHDLGLDVDG